MVHIDNMPFIELGAALERALGDAVVPGLGGTPIYCAYERSFDAVMPGSGLDTIAALAIRDHLVGVAHLGQHSAFLAELTETFGVALVLPGLQAAPRGHFPHLCWLPHNGNAPSRHFGSLAGLAFALIHKLDDHGTCVVASAHPVLLELLAPAAVAHNQIQIAHYRPFSFQHTLHAFDKRRASERLGRSAVRQALSGDANNKALRSE